MKFAEPYSYERMRDQGAFNLGHAPVYVIQPQATIVQEDPGTSTRDRERLLQGLGAVYSPRRAAELLPGDDASNRAWLREQGLVHTRNGKEEVVWDEVLEKLKGAPTDAPTPAKTGRTRRGEAPIPRFGLRR